MREIELKPSRLLGLLLTGMSATVLGATGLAGLPAGVQLALGLTVIALAARGWRRASVPASLRIAVDGGLQSLDDSAEWRDAEVQRDSFASPMLIVLRYRVAGGPMRTLTLLSDSADAEDLRRLRVSLRWARRTRSDTSFPDAG